MRPARSQPRLGIQALLEPASIAVVGASPRPASPGYRALRNLAASRFAGRVVAITDRHREVLGIRCTPRPAAMDEPVDLALVSLPAEYVGDTVRELGERGTRNIVVFSSGFAEIGPAGQLLQDHLVELSMELRLNVVGPNCMGLINVPKGIAATFSEILPPAEFNPGSLSFVSQSGGLGVIVYHLAAASGLGFGCFISSGNEADLELADYIELLTDDEPTRTIGAYVEHLKDGRRLLAAIQRAHNANKQVVLIHGGRQRSGARAASSHTGALASDHRVVADVLAQAGCLLVEDPQMFVDVAQLLRTGRRPAGRRVAVVANSGGTAVLAGDLAEEAGLTVPELAAPTRARLVEIMPVFSAPTNPVDVTAEVFFQPDRFGEILRCVAADPAADNVVVISAFSAPFVDRVAEVVSPLLESLPGSRLVLWYAGSPRTAATFRHAGIPYFDDPARALRALSLLCSATGSSLPADFAAAAGAVLPPGPTENVDEFALKTMLAAAGFGLPAFALAETTGQAVEVATAIGFPVAMKLVSGDVPHKASAGVMRLNIGDPVAVAGAYRAIVERGIELEARSPGVLIEEMVGGGAEFLLGMTTSSYFGPVLAFGVGGADVEQIGQVQFAVLPLSPDGAGQLVQRVGLEPLPPAQFSALTDLVLRFADWCWQQRHWLFDIDLNPVRYSDGALTILDAFGSTYTGERSE